MIAKYQQLSSSEALGQYQPKNQNWQFYNDVIM